MKKFMAMAMLIFIGVAGWRVGERLSADALGMALGVLFGVMAGIPAALMVLAAHRRENEQGHGAYQHSQRGRNQQYPQLPFAPQPPVIVMAAPTTPAQQLPSQQMSPQQAFYDSGLNDGYANHGQHPQHMLPAHQQQTIETRQFRVVGETEELLEEY